MPAQDVKGVAASLLEQALQGSQILTIHLRSIEVRLQDEIDTLKNGWWTPKHLQKAALLEAAQALVIRVKTDCKEEQETFKKELKEGTDE